MVMEKKIKGNRENFMKKDDYHEEIIVKPAKRLLEALLELEEKDATPRRQELAEV